MELLIESPARFAPQTFGSARGRLRWSISRLLTRTTTQAGAIFDLSSMTSCGACPSAIGGPSCCFTWRARAPRRSLPRWACPGAPFFRSLARAREQLRIRLSRRNLALSVGVFASLLERTASSDAAVPDRLLDLGMQTLPASGAGVSAQARLLAQQVLKDMLRHRLWTIGSLLFAALLATWVGFLSYGAVRVPPVAVAPRALAVVQAEARSDLDGLQGDWQVVAVEQGGRVLPKDQFPFTSLRIRDDTIVHEGGPHHLLKVRFRLHPEQQPKAMDMESEGYHGDIYHAIYALEGDTLTICRPDDATRPTEFASSPGSNVLLYTAKRIRPAGP